VGAGVDVADHDAARGRTKQAFDRAQGAGLARAVGAEQAEDLALVDFEVDAIDGDQRPVRDPKAGDPERWRRVGGGGLRRGQDISSEWRARGRGATLP
jgi:hypothetical protein